MVITRTLIPQADAILDKATSIDKIKDLKVIELLEVILKHDRKGSVSKKYIKDKVVPKCHAYLSSFRIEDIGSDKGKKMPHIIVFPWLTVIKP